MVDDNLVTITLKENFYKDSFKKLLLVIAAILCSIAGVVSLSLYLHFNKPSPVHFLVRNEFRIQPEIPINQAYISQPDLMQWLSRALTGAFVVGFLDYTNQLKQSESYFTNNGWRVFLNHMNTYANQNTVQNLKLFVNAGLAGAPILLNQWLDAGRYTWCIQMPMTINYQGYHPPQPQSIDIQVRVVRVSTLQNLSGVGIENVIIQKSIDPNRGCVA